MRNACTATLALLAATLAAGCTEPGDAHRHDGHTSPYAAWRGNELRAIPPEDVQALQEGSGMGYALAAELNGYVGPRHVLELAAELGLDAQQREQTEALYARMNAQARAAGEEVLQAYVALEELFRRGEPSPEAVEAASREVGLAEGRLRAIHLNAHLEADAILTDPQVQRYQELRGYGGSNGHGHAAPVGAGTA
ncbi:MAG TPA: hypothetical protein VFH47_07640 [Candidatus Thermoplasmatota archaeon]|nr:hypothetical protein [Candidatus Thermoplasmatota archaeon]